MLQPLLLLQQRMESRSMLIVAWFFFREVAEAMAMAIPLVLSRIIATRCGQHMVAVIRIIPQCAQRPIG